MYNKLEFKHLLDTLFDCAQSNCKDCSYRYADDCFEYIVRSVANHLVSATILDTDGDVNCPVIIL